jgi:hypothetical protein
MRYPHLVLRSIPIFAACVLAARVVSADVPTPGGRPAQQGEQACSGRAAGTACVLPKGGQGVCAPTTCAGTSGWTKDDSGHMYRNKASYSCNVCETAEVAATMQSAWNAKTAPSGAGSRTTTPISSATSLSHVPAVTATSSSSSQDGSAQPPPKEPATGCRSCSSSQSSPSTFAAAMILLGLLIRRNSSA